MCRHEIDGKEMKKVKVECTYVDNGNSWSDVKHVDGDTRKEETEAVREGKGRGKLEENGE